MTAGAKILELREGVILAAPGLPSRRQRREKMPGIGSFCQEAQVAIRKIGKRITVALILGLVILVGLSPAANANLVTNGGFETGDFSGWLVSGDLDWVGVGTDLTELPEPGDVHSGAYAAYFGNWTSYSYITQTLATTPGQTYFLQFYVANNSGPEEWVNHFAAYWDGVSLSGGGTPALPQENVAPFNYDGGTFSGYSAYLFTVTASGCSTVLQFEAENFCGWYFLDDVSVVSTPLPPALLLLGSGLLALGGLKRLRKSQAVGRL
jgi:hypothetical protein